MKGVATARIANHMMMWSATTGLLGKPSRKGPCLLMIFGRRHLSQALVHGLAYGFRAGAHV